MKSNKAKLFTTLTVMLTSCGTENDKTDQKSTDGARPASTAEKAPAKDDSVSLQFKGYVGGAFPITVDGISYEDSEDFYTRELQNLPEKIRKAGYDKSWKWSFDAVVGFQDLRTNMMVYIAPQEKKGYQGEAPVSYAGGFEIALPQEASDANYMVRAVKRVNVILERGADVVKICYNFSAINLSVPFQEKSKPIILDQFTTRLTAYACESANSSSGIKIPNIDVPVAPQADTTTPRATSDSSNVN
jgi:hypothetical protein